MIHTIGIEIAGAVINPFLLKKIKATVKQWIEKNRKQSENADYVQKQIKEFVDKVSSLDKFVIYTVGRDTRGLIKYLPAEVVEQLEYCDKSARTFNGRIVEPPEQLLQKYKDYTIVVSSTMYAAEAMMAMHRGTTRHLFCPKCNKRTWCKKIIKK